MTSSSDTENDMPWLWAGPPLYYRRTRSGLLANPFIDIDLVNAQEDEAALYKPKEHSGYVPEDEQYEVRHQSRQDEARLRGNFQIYAETRYYRPMRETFLAALCAEKLEIGPCGVALPTGPKLPFTRIPEDVFRHVRKATKKSGS